MFGTNGVDTWISTYNEIGNTQNMFSLESDISGSTCRLKIVNSLNNANYTIQKVAEF